MRPHQYGMNLGLVYSLMHRGTSIRKGGESNEKNFWKRVVAKIGDHSWRERPTPESAEKGGIPL